MEIACAYSHIRAWQIAHALNVDELFVFEDDAKILRSLQAVHCDDTVDILYLSDRVGRTPSGEALDGCGTEGYLLSRQGLEKCLHIFRKLYMPIDLQLMAHQVSWANHRRGLAQFRQRLPEESYLNAMAVAAPYCTHDDHSSSTIE